MKIFHKFMTFLFLAFFTANATPPDQFEQEKGNIADPSKLDNTKVSVYLHPIFLIIGGASQDLILYSTVEIPLSLYNAPIIKPSVWNIGNVLRVGSDFGFRHYLAGKGDGLYIQPQVGVFYFSVEDSYSNSIFDFDDSQEGTWFDTMLYLGRSSKFAYISIYYDAGIGYACTYVSGSNCSLMFDANLGIGISF